MILPFFMPLPLNNMYSPWQRVGTMLTFSLSCLLLFALPLIATSSLFLTPPAPPVSLDVNHVKVFRAVEDAFMNRMSNLVEFNLSLEADFQRLFHWNTKQVYVYVAVEYETDKSVLSTFFIIQ
jgi:signal peptidase complex subunit 3